ncbi:hypothetical protein ILYODFUR_024891 [Ilyodon furcidens]|uniref:Uncharacterized protein n=1 Tax=Ilyodon furcidens TaxID=33524 RepID=A0ABV0UXT2_9TELE
MTFFNMSWYAEGIRFPFTFYIFKEPSPTPTKQPHTIIPLPPYFQTQSGKYCPKRVHWIARQKGMIHHSREYISTALECSGGLLYTSLHLMLCTRLGCSCLSKETHKTLYALFMT